MWNAHQRMKHGERVIRVGYYWLTLRAVCTKYVKKCKECQEFNHIHHALPEELHNITSPWPFTMWGMNILEPFPIAKSQIEFLLAMVDYFTKWIEADPLQKITAQKVQKFT